MIEIDSSIISAEVLYDRVKTSAKMKSIPKEFYGDTAYDKAEAVGVNRMKEEMLSVYQNLQMMNASWVIGEKPIMSNRPVIGKAIVFCKKVFRKLTRWLFRTYYDQQTVFNGAVTRTISDMIKVQEMLIQLYEQNERKEEQNAD